VNRFESKSAWIFFIHMDLLSVLSFYFFSPISKNDTYKTRLCLYRPLFYRRFKLSVVISQFVENFWTIIKKEDTMKF